ncbi:MAG TPA: GNAT family N-acetyltransferase [Pyrinomonadaceae bacterium]|jgi:RimJ/RimL family protein N-acetyltransferase
MHEYGTSQFQFKDSAARHIREADIPAVINLFKLNYGDAYAIPEFYDEHWVKRGIYSDHIIWLVLEEAGEVVASGACVLDYGDYNDQIGEIGRLVVHPERKGRGLGRRIVDALLDATDDTVEFAFGEARTVHPLSQALFEKADFAAIGFLPQTYTFGDARESFVLYARLYGNGQAARCEKLPEVIPEVAPLARHALRAMGLPDDLNIQDACEAYPAESICTVQPMDRRSLARLVRIEHGRLIEPLLFGGLSLDQGISHIRRRQALYLMALDEQQRPVGAVGFQVDGPSQLVKGIELVAAEDDLRGHLCSSLLRQAEDELGAQVIEVNVSAYDARLQRSFASHGFLPVAYAPAMVFHGTHRLDVIKMLKLNVPYNPGALALTDEAQSVVSIVEKGFTSESGPQS